VQFRSKQADVIEAALASKDTCVLWPTGSGKSICYQLPALHSKKTVLVVSPLISLMTDQVLLSVFYSFRALRDDSFVAPRSST
jgi:ATP-dependent DNA helicase RecQ